MIKGLLDRMRERAIWFAAEKTEEKNKIRYGFTSCKGHT